MSTKASFEAKLDVRLRWLANIKSGLHGNPHTEMTIGGSKSAWVVIRSLGIELVSISSAKKRHLVLRARQSPVVRLASGIPSRPYNDWYVVEQFKIPVKAAAK